MLLPALNYHGLEHFSGEYGWNISEKPYVVNLDVFEKQMNYIVRSGFLSLSLEEVGKWLRIKGEYKRPIVLTFDDGHISHFEYAAPCLRQNKLKAVFFVSAGWVGKENQMNWEHLRELVRQGFEIGSHGLTHIPLTKLSNEALASELCDSKKTLEDRLGIQVKGFSVPRGYFSERVRGQALRTGYRFVFTSLFDFNSFAEDPYFLRRLVVTRSTSFETFDGIIHGNLGFKKWWERAKETARSVIKPEWYDALSGFKQALLRGQRA